MVSIQEFFSILYGYDYDESLDGKHILICNKVDDKLNTAWFDNLESASKHAERCGRLR